MRFFKDRSEGQESGGGLFRRAASPDPGADESAPQQATTRPLTAPVSRPSRSAGQPFVGEPPYEDPFAARARLRSRPARGPVRRRIWDIEEEGAGSATAVVPQPTRGTADALPDGEAWHEPVPDPAYSPASYSPALSPPAPAWEAGDAIWEDPVLRAASAPEPAPAPDPAPSSAPPADRTVAEARAQVARLAEQGTALPAASPLSNGSSRAKTRVLGFQSRDLDARDPFAQGATRSAPAAGPDFPVGWIVVSEGPGRGASFTLQAGVSSIGRGEDQVVRLDFGDTSISRQTHASIAFDDESERFYLGHGGKSNLVRLNGRPVLSTEELTHGDVIRIGETALRFVALCGDGFSWAAGSDTGAADGAAH